MSDNKDLSFSKLREEYSEFVYKGYSVNEIPGAFHVEYDMEIPGLSEFKAKWDFPFEALSADGSDKKRHIDAVNDEIFNELVFALGMVECISYYKITCPKVFRIECHKLNDKQILWWRKLIYNGLGEFMYRNGIDVTEEELVNIICKPTREYALKSSEEKTEPLHDECGYDGFLVPVGGGKDSVVSLELLKGKDIVTYTVNGNATTKAVIDICTHKSGDYVAKRVLDKRMLDLNAAGYLNGHTPFSAIVAFSSVITAYITGRKYIVLSNENSANETTVKDSFVNHQYSKSYEFEKDFEEYFKNITDSDIHYFSMLRPLTELQIAALFAKDKEYHKVFRSCNVGSKQGIWCCDCPKCLFVYIILSPFLSQKELKDIFGEKLLDKESLDKDFRELVGIEENKPFECVGTRREVVSCMKYCRKAGLKSLLTDRYADYIDQNGEDLDLMLKEWNEIHNVPAELESAVKLGGINGKRILIWGYGREGKSTESFLKRCAAPVSVDILEGSREEIDEDKYDLIFKSPGIRMDDDDPKYTSQTEVFLEAYRDRVIGITGTKGKSTTSTLMYEVLSKCTGRPVLLLGNIGRPCLDHYDEVTDDTLIVYEMSCHQLAHLKVSPHVAVFLNLYEEHLDYYDTLDRYFTAKSHIATAQRSEDFFYVGSNVPHIDTAAAVKVIDPANIGDYELLIRGEHNKFNAEFVFRIATEVYGCEPDKVKEVLASTKGLSHRLEYVGRRKDVSYYDDSISTIPEAAISALSSIGDASTILIGGMDRGIDYDKLTDYIEKHPEYNYICMYASGKRIYDTGVISSLPYVYYEEDLEAAVKKAEEITSKGAIILSPAAASYDHFKNFEERGDCFKKLIMIP